MELLFMAPKKPTMDIKNITAPMLSTGIVRDFLQASGRVLIHTPNIITTMAKTMVRKLIHLVTKVLVPIPIFSEEGKGKL